jgi:uncharacterized protein YndB with AHSA1/START domain
MKALIIGVALAAALAAPALAADKFPDVTVATFTEAGGSRSLQFSIDIDAPAKLVFDAFTDASLITRWESALAVIDLRQGGSMEESYTPGAKGGDPENIRHEIIAYVPGRMLVYRNTNAPSRLPGRELYKQVVSVLEVQDLGPGRSRLVVSQAGYGPGAEFDKLYAFFKAENPEAMHDLKTALESPTGKLHGLVR